MRPFFSSLGRNRCSFLEDRPVVVINSEVECVVRHHPNISPRNRSRCRPRDICHLSLPRRMASESNRSDFCQRAVKNKIKQLQC